MRQQGAEIAATALAGMKPDNELHTQLRLLATHRLDSYKTQSNPNSAKLPTRECGLTSRFQYSLVTQKIPVIQYLNLAGPIWIACLYFLSIWLSSISCFRCNSPLDYIQKLTTRLQTGCIELAAVKAEGIKNTANVHTPTHTNTDTWCCQAKLDSMNNVHHTSIC